MEFLDEESWDAIQYLFPATRRTSVGRPPTDPRAIVSAILWVQDHGGRWIHLPNHFPAQQTCYQKYLAWKKDGRLQEALDILLARSNGRASLVAASLEIARFDPRATAFS